MEPRFWKRVNAVQLIILIVLFLLAVFLVPGIPNQFLSFGHPPGEMFNTYLLPDFDDSAPQLPFLVSKILGTTLNMDWYDVCVINTSSLKSGTTTIPAVPIAAEIMPLQSNVDLAGMEAWADNLSSMESQSNSHLIFSDELMVMPDTRTCLYALSSDNGFLYGGPFVVINSKDVIGMTLPEQMSSTLAIPLGNGDSISLNGSRLEVSTNIYALWIKRITLFLALFGIYLLLRELWSLIIKPKQN